jgi:hypothetical protein
MDTSATGCEGIAECPRDPSHEIALATRQRAEAALATCDITGGQVEKRHRKPMPL